MTARTYSEAEKAEAVALSMTIPTKVAAKRLGIPWRTLYRWKQQPTPVIAGIIEATRQDVASALWEVVAAGSQEALRRIRDPGTRAGELAQLLKVAAEQHALLTGGPTSRTETRDTTVSDADRAQVYEFLDALDAATDDELRQWAADGGLAMLRDTTPTGQARKQFAELEAGDTDA